MWQLKKSLQDHIFLSPMSLHWILFEAGARDDVSKLFKQTRNVSQLFLICCALKFTVIHMSCHERCHEAVTILNGKGNELPLGSGDKDASSWVRWIYNFCVVAAFHNPADVGYVAMLMTWQFVAVNNSAGKFKKSCWKAEFVMTSRLWNWFMYRFWKVKVSL
jgi:hypothetical protein